MSKVTIDTSITINVEQADGIVAVLTLTIEEARALKDELIRAVGAQNPPGYAPVLTPRGGFINTDATQQRRLATVSVGGHEKRIPEHLLKRAEAAREAADQDVRGNGVLHPNARCHCGDPGWGSNGACGVSGCNNVPA